jgi:starch synthase
MMRKRVAIFVEHFPPFLGSDRTIYELGTRLPEYGYKVHFVVTQPLRYLLGQRPKDWEYTKNWKTGPPNLGGNISAKYLLLPKAIRKMWSRLKFIAFPLSILYFILLAMFQVIRFKPDVIIAAHATPIVGVVATATAKLLRIPEIMECPDLMSEYASQLAGGREKNVGIALLRTLEVFLIKLASSSFTVSHYLKGVLVSLGVREQSIKVIPNGVDIEVFTEHYEVEELKKEANLTGRSVVLYSGHIEAWAGSEILEPLVRRMATEEPEAVLVLVGSGDSVEKLISDVKESGTEDNFRYLGLKPYDEMPRVIAAADVAICVFADNLASHAASPLKLFEYMSCGKAIVATSVAGTAEALRGGAGVLVEPGNVDGFCEQVIELCRHPERRKELGEISRQIVNSHHSWRVLSGDLSTLILDTIRG